MYLVFHWKVFCIFSGLCLAVSNGQIPCWNRGCFIGFLSSSTCMGDEQPNEQKQRIALDTMPPEIQQLAEVMLGINPQWSLENWLIEQAEATLDLISVDLLKERMVIEQRIQRLEDLGKRLDSTEDDQPFDDPHQRNLFDCFDMNEPHALRGLGERAITSQDDSQHEAHSFINLLPDENTDDPLLAITCQHILMAVDAELTGGEPVATLEAILEFTHHSNIEVEEVEEALDHLLAIGGLLEVDDDCFIPVSK